MDEVKVLAPKGLKEYVDKKIQNRIRLMTQIVSRAVYFYTKTR